MVRTPNTRPVATPYDHHARPLGPEPQALVAEKQALERRLVEMENEGTALRAQLNHARTEAHMGGGGGGGSSGVGGGSGFGVVGAAG